MKVIIDIDEKYARVLSITAIKSTGLETNVATAGVDLEKGQYLKIDDKGKLHQIET